MDVSTRYEGGIPVLVLSGRFDGVNAGAVQPALDGLRADHHRRCGGRVLNLQERF